MTRVELVRNQIIHSFDDWDRKVEGKGKFHQRVTLLYLIEARNKALKVYALIINHDSYFFFVDGNVLHVII